MPYKSEEITDLFNPLSIADGVFKKDQILKFNFEGSITCLKITKVNKKSRRMWAREVELYKEDEVDVVDNKTGKVVDAS